MGMQCYRGSVLWVKSWNTCNTMSFVSSSKHLQSRLITSALPPADPAHLCNRKCNLCFLLKKSEPCIWRWPGWWPLARWGSIRTLGGTGSDTEKWNSCVILFFHSNTRDQMLLKICISQLKFLPVCIPTQVYQWPLDRRGSKGQSWSFVLHLKSFTLATS